MNERWDTSEQQSLLESKAVKDISSKMPHVSSPIHTNYKRKLSLMLVYIAAATRYFIVSSHSNEKHCATTNTTDYYTGLLTTTCPHLMEPDTWTASVLRL